MHMVRVGPLAVLGFFAIAFAGCTSPPDLAQSETGPVEDADWVMNQAGREQTFDEAFAKWTKVGEFRVTFPKNPVDARPGCPGLPLGSPQQAIRVSTQLQGQPPNGLASSGPAAVDFGNGAETSPPAVEYKADARAFLTHQPPTLGGVAFNGALEYNFQKLVDARMLPEPATTLGCVTKGWTDLVVNVVIETGEPVRRD